MSAIDEVSPVQIQLAQAISKAIEAVPNVGNPATHARSYRELAEALAWLSRPDQPHGGGSS